MPEKSPVQVRELSLSNASIRWYDQCFGPWTIHGYSIGLCFNLGSSAVGVNITITLTLGNTPYTWTETFDGDVSYNLPITTGLSLTVAISDWESNSCFTFNLSIKVLIWGIGTNLYTQPIQYCPETATEQSAAFASVPISSPRDLADLLGLLGQVTQNSGGTCQCAADPRRQQCSYAGGRCNPGYIAVCGGYPTCNCKCVTQ